MNIERIEETRKMTEEALADEYGTRWREVAPLVLRRVPELLDEVKRLSREIEAQHTRADSLSASLAERERTLEAYDQAVQTARIGLIDGWDDSLSAPEALTVAVRRNIQELGRISTELDRATQTFMEARELIDVQSLQIETLKAAEASLPRLKAQVDELLRQAEDLRFKLHNEHEEKVNLTESLAGQEDRLKTVREIYDGQVETLRTDVKTVHEALQASLQDAEMWKSRAHESERLVEQLTIRLAETEAQAPDIRESIDNAVQEQREILNSLRTSYEERVGSLQNEMALARDAVEAATQMMDEWKDRALLAESRVDELAAKVSNVETSLQQALQS